MQCIKCGNHKTSITNSRANKKSHHVWRRHTCSQCSTSFTTHEIPDFKSLITVKTALSSTGLSTTKLRISLFKALNHLSNADQAIDYTLSIILEGIIENSKNNNSQINNTQISELCAKTLGKYDTTAAIKYASAHGNLTANDLKRIIHKK